MHARTHTPSTSAKKNIIIRHSFANGPASAGGCRGDSHSRQQQQQYWNTRSMLLPYDGKRVTAQPKRIGAGRTTCRRPPERTNLRIHTHTHSLTVHGHIHPAWRVRLWLCVCVYYAGLDVDGWIGVEQAYRGCRFSLSPFVFVCVYCMIVLLCCRCALRLTHTMCSDALSISLSGNCHLKTW